MLHDRLGDLLSGKGSVVLISGEAGASVLTGGCYDLTTTPPYGPYRGFTGLFLY